MKFSEIKKVGLSIFLLNLVLVLFIMTGSGDLLGNLVVCIISSIIACCLNGYYLYKTKKSAINIIACVLNFIMLIGLITYSIVKFI